MFLGGAGARRRNIRGDSAGRRGVAYAYEDLCNSGK